MDNSKNNAQLLKEVDQLKARISELEKSDLKSRFWLENSPICTKIIDLDFNLQFMSASGVRELKIDDITEFYGKPYPIHFYPDSFKIPMSNNLKIAKETGNTITQEALITDIQGNELWYHSTIIPVNDDKGELDYIMVVSMETTERKLAEEALHESEERFRTLVEQSTVAIEIYEPEGKLLIVNNAWSKFWNLKKETIANFNILNDPECERTGLTAAFKKSQQGKAEILSELLYDPEESGLSGGRKRWISARMYPIKEIGRAHV